MNADVIPVLVTLRLDAVPLLEEIRSKLEKVGLKNVKVIGRRSGIIKGTIDEEHLNDLRIEGVKDVAPEGQKGIAAY